jgi:hypothetical protein
VGVKDRFSPRSRVAFGPGGRKWTITRRWFTWPDKRWFTWPTGPDEADAEDEPEAWIEGEIHFEKPRRGSLKPLLDAVAIPLVLDRPWIEARAASPTTCMVWRVSGRQPSRAAMEEIAEALERGEDRPTPLSARWVGYGDSGIRLYRKLGR